jgi:hypothetical protein
MTRKCLFQCILNAQKREKVFANDQDDSSFLM